LVNVPGTGTLLHRAAAYGHIEVARLLLRYGAHIAVKDDLEQTPLDLAKAMNRTEMLRLLLEFRNDSQHSGIVSTLWSSVV